ncbi:MAG: GatB/YqeY domain-containing protein [Phycisphaerae bacterium]
MDLRQRLQEEMKAAMKAGQKQRLGTIRMLLAELKNEDMRAGRRADDVAVVQRYAKRLSKSMEEFRRVGVADRAEQIQAELAVVEEFLPRRMDEQQLTEAIERVLAEHGIDSPRQIGQAMGILMKQYPGQVDGARAQQILKAKLTPG